MMVACTMTKTALALATILLCGCHRAADIAAMRMADKDWQRPNQIAAANPSHPAWLLVFDGDSITVGHGLRQQESYPARVVRALQESGENIDAFNVARCFDTTVDLLGRAAQTDSLAVRKPYAKRVLIAWAGTNDLYRGETVEMTSGRIRRYISGRESAGFRVLYLAPMARPQGGKPLFFERSRLRLIGLFGNGIQSVGAPALLDGVHLDSAGAAQVASSIVQMLHGL
jgi:acyl-CoA thioesterase-1